MTPKVPSILEAVRADSLQGVRAALDEDPLVLCRAANRRREPILITALRRACSPGLTTVLLQGGADPNCSGLDGMSALDMLVAMRGACRAQEEHNSLPWMQHVSPVAPWDGQATAALEVDITTTQAFAVHSDGVPIDTRPVSDERRCVYATTLLAFGADANRKAKDGFSAAERAEQAGQSSFARYLSHWAGGQLDVLRRTSSSLAKQTPTLSPMSAAHFLCAPSPQAADPMVLVETGQASVEPLPDELLVRICNMLAPMSM